MDRTVLLEDLKRIEASIATVINQIESECTKVTATIADIRKVAILEEIYRLGGRITADEVSCLAKKYGKTPSSTAGYYSGKSPSLTADKIWADASLARKNWFTGEGRYITERGRLLVEEKRKDWGEDWLDRIPQKIVCSEANALNRISF